MLSLVQLEYSDWTGCCGMFFEFHSRLQTTKLKNLEQVYRAKINLKAGRKVAQTDLQSTAKDGCAKYYSEYSCFNTYTSTICQTFLTSWGLLTDNDFRLIFYFQSKTFCNRSADWNKCNPDKSDARGVNTFANDVPYGCCIVSFWIIQLI